jgi:hypothetical protein
MVALGSDSYKDSVELMEILHPAAIPHIWETEVDNREIFPRSSQGSLVFQLWPDLGVLTAPTPCSAITINQQIYSEC